MVNFRKTRYAFWVLQAFIKRHFVLVIVGVVFGIIASLLVASLFREKPRLSNKQTIGIVGDFTTETLPTEVLSNLSRGLTNIAPDGQPLPGLASSWNISPDFLTYSFYLNPSATWVDGTPVKPKDIDYHFKDATMKALENSVVEIKLKESYTPLPVIVSRPIFKSGFVGTGPYKLSAIKTSGGKVSEVDLAALPTTGREDLNYHFYPTEETAITAWQMSEVKKVENLTLPPPEGWKVTIDKKVNKDRFVGLFFNLQDPMVQDKSIRQGLAYGLKDKAPEGAPRAYGPISPDSWAVNKNLKRYDYDKTKAIQLIGKVASNSASVHLTISTFSTLLPLAESIKKDWQALGLQVDTQVISAIPDNFQVLLITQATPPDPDQYNLWHSTNQTSNLTRLKNPKIDKLLEDGRKTEGMAARKAIYFDFQKTIVEELPVIFLYHPVTYTITRP